MKMMIGQTSNVSAMKPTSSQELRSKFLNMIGIERPATPDSSLTDKGELATVSPTSTRINPRSQGVNSFQVPLKYDQLADKKYSSPKRRKTEGTRAPKAARSLAFNETVEVLPIPMRHEYSNRVRSRLWSNAVEIQENAARNVIEFQSEKYVLWSAGVIESDVSSVGRIAHLTNCLPLDRWDWRAVKEDEQMYRCVATGELIHPCHYEYAMEMAGAPNRKP
jgi:hypothetical protein